MTRLRISTLCVLALVIVLGGCATRPINPAITQADPNAGYRFVTHAQKAKDRQNLVILAFSGGGTRAAAFSYGVLEALRPMVLTGPKGNSIRMLDEVDVVTGISGGSFTALAYALYGERLFDLYESSFLKRDVQGELIARTLSPAHWGDWARAETAEALYDEILFHGATFADLDRGNGPFAAVSATDISTGARMSFNQGLFDFICSDVNAVPLARAATASSAVPFAFSPITLNNYGGRCHFTLPPFLSMFTDPATAPRPAARLLAHLQDLRSYENSTQRPYVHLLDGGLSDNLGMRGVLEVLDDLEAANSLGIPTPLDDVRRIIIFVVNSRSSPKTNWDQSERPPGAITLLVKAAGVPIDHYSFETLETLKDTIARWQTMRKIRESAAFAANKDPAIAQMLRTPSPELYAIDVSFGALSDEAERDYLNDLPTSFVLPPEAVDRLRAAARRIVLDSPDFKRLLKDVGATMTEQPAPTGPPAAQ